MGSTIKYIRIVAAIYLALYSLLNCAFLHHHDFGGEIISHSHPFSDKSHTEGEAKLILHINTAPADLAFETAVPEDFTEFHSTLGIYSESNWTERFRSFKKLRGPPHIFLTKSI